ncbi:HlyD family efflux transporter periplasmic adaptor subunit [Pseudomonas putida]|uniref:HlyD family efflux transporter periplasmic adaptor subunit n=1 Tax=Pseudomonas putida TaxID=303 RepID=A0A2Z4RI41_PSEPU|nr:HlyD family efflux transporter periplasmic adaptor subunit [Pseudomonas putida]AWY40750.1 HlyD family efflux transporter periplasmic adaptor subunit [Pseudomonas putida]
MENTPLFRNEALEAKQQKPLGNIVLVWPLSFTTLTLFSVFSAMLIGIFFIWGSYTKRTTVIGQLILSSGQIKIYAPQYGRILESFVHEGQFIKKGQRLLVISSERYDTGLNPVQAEISDSLMQRKASLLDEIEKQKELQLEEKKSLLNKLSSAKEEVKNLDQQISDQRKLTLLASDASNRYQALMEKGYISMDQFQQRQTELLSHNQNSKALLREHTKLQQQITDYQNELSSLPAKHSNQLSMINRNLSSIEQNIVESEAKRLLVITAPDDGVATAVLAESGQTVDSSRPVLSLIPNSALLQAEFYAPSKSIGFIKTGDSVRIRYQSFPYQKFGQHLGHVKSISKTSISPSELASMTGAVPGLGLDGEQFYRIRVDLEKQQVLAYGELRSLQTGMLLEADIFQESRRLYEWVLEPLYSLTGKL